MSDIMSSEARSALMSRIRSKDTRPELIVRRLAHKLGFRYRLHKRELPGTPDLVFPGKRKVIFVHGCFWHQHDGCKFATIPKTRREFWVKKLQKNEARDKQAMDELRSQNWDSMVIWECETSDTDKLITRIEEFLNS